MSDTLTQLRTFRNDTSALYGRSVKLNSQFIGLQQRTYALGNSCREAEAALGPAMADSFDSASGAYGDSLGGAVGSMQTTQGEVQTLGGSVNAEGDGCKSEFKRLTEALKATLAAMPAGPAADALAMAVQSLQGGASSEASAVFVTSDIFPRCSTVLTTAAAQAKEISGDTAKNPGDVSAAAFRAKGCIQEASIAYNQVASRAVSCSGNQNQASHLAGTARDQISQAIIFAEQQGI